MWGLARDWRTRGRFGRWYLSLTGGRLAEVIRDPFPPAWRYRRNESFKELLASLDWIVHLSIFRFLPTFAIGIMAAVVVVRSRSIIPAMVLHAVYNGVAVFQDSMPDPIGDWLGGTVTGWAISLLALAAGAMLVRHRTDDAYRQSPSRSRPSPPT